MLKLKTIGMIEKNSKGNPTVKAHTELKNGALHTVSSSGVTVYPVAGSQGTPQTKNLCIALNTGAGDNLYTEFNIPENEFVNSYLLKAWDGQEIVFDESHITYGNAQSYASIIAGATKLVAGTDGKFEISVDVSNYGIYFDVTEKLQFNGNAVSAKIVLN